MAKAIFFDKDGTLIPDIPYNTDPEKIEFNEGAAYAIRRLSALDFMLIVVSNQSGVARGYFREADLQKVREKLEGLFRDAGGMLSDFIYCPHLPEGSVKEYAITCDCRKPMPGMLLSAGGKHNIDLRSSWMIGDILNDIEAGNLAGCRTILINNGNETEWLQGNQRVPGYIAKDLADAAEYVISSQYSEREII